MQFSSVPPIGSPSPSSGENSGQIPESVGPNLNGRKISMDDLGYGEKLNPCWKSTERDKFKETQIVVIVAESFVPDDDDDVNFGDESTGIFFDTDASTTQLVSGGEKSKSTGEKSESEGEGFESMGEKLEASTIIRSQSEIENVGNLLDGKLKDMGCVCRSTKAFEEDVSELQNELNRSPEKREELIEEFIENAVDQGKIGKLINGEFVELNKEEKEKIKKELKIFFRDYFALYPFATQKQTEEQPNKDQHTDKSTKAPHNYVMVVFSPHRRIFNNDRSAQNIIIIRQLAILADILKQAQEKTVEERKQITQAQLNERILAAILKSEILKSDFLKSEIKLQDIKFEVNKELNIPVYVLIKINKIIKNSNRRELVSLLLPGFHKMKPLAAKVA